MQLSPKSSQVSDNRPRSDPDTVAIAPTVATGLKVPSSVRFDKIATIEKHIIAGRIGDADIRRIEMLGEPLRGDEGRARGRH